jgi:membrane-associated protease RseP (regulator of RpoE activity)
MNFFELLLLFLIFSAVATFLLKRFFKTESWVVFSLIKTKKPLWVFDYLARFKKVFGFLSKAGLVLGFGALAIDYFWGRGKPLRQRLVLLFFSLAGLAIVFILIDFLLGGFVSGSPFSKNVFYWITFSFSLLGFAGFSLVSLLFHALQIILSYIAGEPACPGVAPIIPGVEIPNVPISPPLIAWLPLFLILIIHESAHGAVARLHKMKLKSTGVLLFGLLPIGAFVEPDEEEVSALSKTNPSGVLEMLSAGPSANLAAMALTIPVFFAVAFLISVTIVPWETPISEQIFAGVDVAEVKEYDYFCKKEYPSPAFGKVEEGWKIIGFNGEPVNSLGELKSKIALLKGDAGVFAFLDYEENEQTVELTKNELGSFGLVLNQITNEGFVPPAEYYWVQGFKKTLVDFFNWFFLLNLLIAIVNFLPFPVFDGGRILKIIALPYLGFLNKTEKQKEEFLSKVMTRIVLGLLLINALPLFI